MASSYLGDPSLGNERSGSSRKGKKSNSDKPKQPQRGLGVAQLEQIRLSNEMGSCYMPSLHNPSYTSLNQVFWCFPVCFGLLHIVLYFDHYLNLCCLVLVGVFVLIFIHLKGCNSAGFIFFIIFLFHIIFIWFKS
eukprot:TRINITY_DN6155_c0_g1_i3.p2 TRINITY_DN6155_c0_g1~~TRINITY_DN6155_c0_g1_i3.p2  ORF type:complete len:135 (+),score=23.99 TRINITY_DN6155_c0_g1_i3:436-840(+)